MTNRDPNHLFRPGYFAHFGKTSSGSSNVTIAPPGQRDPNHLFRPGFFDHYAVKGSASGSGGSGGGGRGGSAKKKAKVKKAAYSRRSIRPQALHDVWGHRDQAGGQG